MIKNDLTYSISGCSSLIVAEADRQSSEDNLSEREAGDDSDKKVRIEVVQLEKSTNKFWDVEQLATPLKKNKKIF